MYGIFMFTFEGSDLPPGETHMIRRNQFTHNFCLKGCAYTAIGSTFQQLRFEANQYSYMVALESGAVFNGEGYSLQSSDHKIFVQSFYEEQISNTVGGAIVFKNMDDAGITIIDTCVFHNNFGESGGAIFMENGGTLAAFKNYFYLDEGFLEVPEELISTIEAKDELEDFIFLSDSLQLPASGEKPSIANMIRDSYIGDMALETLIPETVLETLDSVIN